MENRKRQRLDVPRNGTPLIALNNSNNEISTTTATLLTAGQNTFFLDNGNELSPLTGDVFLTICDENLSDDSQEFFTIDSETLAAHIKQEEEFVRIVNAQAPPPHQSDHHEAQHQHQHQHPQDEEAQSSALSSPTTTTTTTIQLTGNNSSNLLPASMQLPSGCEIYLVKEFIQNSPPSSSTSNLNVSSTTGPGSSNSSASAASLDLLETTQATKKLCEVLEKDCSTSNSTSSSSSLSSNHNLISNAIQHYVVNGKTKASTANSANVPAPAPAGQVNAGASSKQQHQSQNPPQNVLLDAYKKRDDKRRATHNEVERRRRDKINSWIFKLKEMLPTDFSNNNNSNTNNNNSFNNNTDNMKLSLAASSSATTTPPPGVLPTLQNSCPNGIASTRTPPNDSKSQILIKACDYIKTMQEEIKCLRECLVENEDLRLRNEQLENELQQLRNERNLNNLQNGNSSSFNLTLSSLNNDNSIFGSTSTVSVGSLTSNGGTIASNSSSPTTFIKRELIIRDFVD